MAVGAPIHPEAAIRSALWDRLIEAGGPADVRPSLLHELGIYGGAQGVWVDANRTSRLTADGTGITVGFLHTGRHYADDLTADSLLYHYPDTKRRGKDAAEIAATKNAAALHVPVFVITTGSRYELRTVLRGEILGWDDGLQIFRVHLLDPYAPSPLRTRRPARNAPGTAVPQRSTQPYRRADEESASAPRDPFTFDPDKIDRGLKSHARTQNALSDWLIARGLTPESPGGLPNFDIAWREGSVRYVGEVKSLTKANEPQQVRLGVGQVLDYAHAMSRDAPSVIPVLVLERAPADPRWLELCNAHGILLVWPESFGRLVERP